MDISLELLPKVYLAVIDKYWYKTVPTDYPASSSEFSLKFDDNDREAVELMESQLNTEHSIVLPSDVAENCALNNYLGTYNVTGTPGEETLLSPERTSDTDIDVNAYHYNEEINGWEKIEDAHIAENGYVYGTVNSFSPISIFTVRKDTYFLTKGPYVNKPTFVANGIPIIVSVDDEGKSIVTDGYGKVTEIPINTLVVGGTVDGSDVESTSVSVVGNPLISAIHAGSEHSSKSDTSAKVKKASVSISNYTLGYIGLTGSYGAVRTEELNITIKNSKISFMGTGESITANTDANKEDKENASFSSKAWVKDVNILLDNASMQLGYISGNCGYMYNDNTVATVKDCNIDYLLACGSNGHTNKVQVTVEGGTYDYFQTTNRGIVDNVSTKIKDATINHFFPTGDSTDSTVTGIIKKVKLDVTNGSMNLYPGTNGGVVINNQDAKNIVESFKISRNTDVNYMENSDIVFSDIIKIK